MINQQDTRRSFIKKAGLFALTVTVCDRLSPISSAWAESEGCNPGPSSFVQDTECGTQISNFSETIGSLFTGETFKADNDCTPAPSNQPEGRPSTDPMSDAHCGTPHVESATSVTLNPDNDIPPSMP